MVVRCSHARRSTAASRQSARLNGCLPRLGSSSKRSSGARRYRIATCAARSRAEWPQGWARCRRRGASAAMRDRLHGRGRRRTVCPLDPIWGRRRQGGGVAGGPFPQLFAGGDLSYRITVAHADHDPDTRTRTSCSVAALPPCGSSRFPCCRPVCQLLRLLCALRFVSRGCREGARSADV